MHSLANLSCRQAAAACLGGCRARTAPWALVLALVACHRGAAPPDAAATGDEAAVAAAMAGDANAVVPSTPLPEAFVPGGTAYVTQTLPVRREASDSKDLAEPGKGNDRFREQRSVHGRGTALRGFPRRRMRR